MTATPKKKGDTKGLSTACTVNFSRVIRKNYKFGSLLSKLTQYDSIWRGKIVYQTYNYLESIISRVCFSREFFSPFFWVCPLQIVGHTPSLSKRTPWKLGIRIVTTSFIVCKRVSWWACGLFLEVIEWRTNCSIAPVCAVKRNLRNRRGLCSMPAISHSLFCNKSVVIQGGIWYWSFLGIFNMLRYFSLPSWGLACSRTVVISVQD